MQEDLENVPMMSEILIHHPHSLGLIVCEQFWA